MYKKNWEKMKSIEMTGEKFNLKIYLSSQDLCRQTVEKIASLVSPGISEKEGQILIKEEFKKVGVTKFWHPSKFRMGQDTLKNFRELPDESIRLQAGDLFFLDVGPIIEDHEADYGKTFALEQNEPSKTLTADVLHVWQKTASQWKENKFSGAKLFSYANQIAKSLGHELNPLMAGHRLGDFPHALFSQENLFSLDINPKENLWVLEIHILNTKLNRGAFFEDILS